MRIEVRRVHEASTGLYGARKVYHQLRRGGGVDGAAVAREEIVAMIAGGFIDNEGDPIVSRNLLGVHARDDLPSRPAVARQRWS